MLIDLVVEIVVLVMLRRMLIHRGVEVVFDGGIAMMWSMFVDVGIVVVVVISGIRIEDRGSVRVVMMRSDMVVRGDVKPADLTEQPSESKRARTMCLWLTSSARTIRKPNTCAAAN